MAEERDILILHDFFFNIGGAEWDAIKMARHFDAPIATFDPPPKDAFEDVKFVNFGTCEGNIFGIREMKIWLTNAVRAFFGRYDDFEAVIINKDWSKGAARFSQSPTLYYCHSPERHLYDLHEYRYEWLKDRSPLKALAFKLFSAVGRPIDQQDIKSVDRIVCNSKNVRNRCQRYYGISPDVIYPPVETDQFYFEEVGDFWLTVGRLGPTKRIEFLIDVFNGVDETLKVVGSPDRDEYYQQYANRAGNNIEFLKSVSWARLKELYANCKALVTAARNEDFGLTPVEAMASGKPVLAVDEGGYRESVVDGETGWLLPLDETAFSNKIRELSQNELREMRPNCVQRASRFSDDRFYAEMTKQIDDIL